MCDCWLIHGNHMASPFNVYEGQQPASRPNARDKRVVIVSIVPEFSWMLTRPILDVNAHTPIFESVRPDPAWFPHYVISRGGGVHYMAALRVIVKERVYDNPFCTRTTPTDLVSLQRTRPSLSSRSSALLKASLPLHSRSIAIFSPPT